MHFLVCHYITGCHNKREPNETDGDMGTLEDWRDERLAKIITLFQAHIRGHILRKSYQKLCDQRVALSIIQRNIRKWLGLKNWMWWKLYTRIKPLLPPSMSSMSVCCSPGGQGAKPTPQLPMTSEVTPLLNEGSSSSSQLEPAPGVLGSLVWPGSALPCAGSTGPPARGPSPVQAPAHNANSASAAKPEPRRGPPSRRKKDDPSPSARRFRLQNSCPGRWVVGWGKPPCCHGEAPSDAVADPASFPAPSWRLRQTTWR